MEQGGRRRLWALLRALEPGYWQALVTVALLSTAHYDVSFVTLHANTVSPSPAERPIMLWFRLAACWHNQLAVAPLGGEGVMMPQAACRCGRKAGECSSETSTELALMGCISWSLG